MRAFPYKAAFYLVLAATGWATFGGYVMGLNTSGIHGIPGCTLLGTGNIPEPLKPAFHAKYGNASDTGLYSLYFCQGPPTDQVKNCARIQAADVPGPWRNMVPNDGLYSCKIS